MEKKLFRFKKKNFKRGYLTDFSYKIHQQKIEPSRLSSPVRMIKESVVMKSLEIKKELANRKQSAFSIFCFYLEEDTPSNWKKRMIDLHINLNEKNELGQSFLHISVSQRNLAAVKFLLDQGIDVNTLDVIL